MVLKKDKFFLLIILILLQSCSGGRFGNFLESSFKNIEEPVVREDIVNNFKNKIVNKTEEESKNNKKLDELKLKEDTKNSFKNKIVIKSESNVEKNTNVKESLIKKDTKNNFKNKIIIKTEEESKNNKNIIKQDMLLQKNKYQPQTYKIIFILKDVDPKDPIKELNTILSNSDVNFEIEKIERFFDSKNKSINSN